VTKYDFSNTYDGTFHEGNFGEAKRTDDAQSAPEFKLNEITMQYDQRRKD
jgi:hypothetical protein